MKKICILLFTIFINFSYTIAQPVQIVTTIKPIHSLITKIVGDTVVVEYLVQGKSSVHNYQLKPSQIKILSQAKILFYVGGPIDSYLISFLRSNSQIKKIHLLNYPKLITLEAIETEEEGHHHSLEEEEEHHHSLEEEEEHHHSLEEEEEHHHSFIASSKDAKIKDPHIWLATENAKVILQIIYQELIKLYPKQQNIFERNLSTAIKEMVVLKENISKRLAPIQNENYLVFHNAYRYFENEYNLNSALSVYGLNQQSSFSAKRWQKIISKIKQQNISCILGEVQFDKKIVNTLSEKYSLKTGNLDPIGSLVPAGKNAYNQTMLNIANELVNCTKK